MISTVITLVIAALLFFAPGENLWGHPSAIFFIITAVSISSIFSLFGIIGLSLFGSSLQKSEQKITPGVIDLYLHDPRIRIGKMLLTLFFPVTLFLLVLFYRSDFLHPVYYIAIWIIYSGIALDALRYCFSKTARYSDPVAVIGMMNEQSRNFTGEADFFNRIENFSEIAYKATDRMSLGVGIAAIDSFYTTCQSYLEKIKKSSEKNSPDKEGVGYFLFYLFERMELINKKALGEGIEPICSKLITTLGKIALECNKYDSAFTGFPLREIEKFSFEAGQSGMGIVREKGTCTLLETAKIMLEQHDIHYVNLKDPFFCMLSILEKIAQSSFREDKSQNISLLNQPFRELKALVESPKLAEHKDKGPLLAEIGRIIDQFEQLEIVMRTIPPVAIKKDKDDAQKETEKS